MINLLHVQNLNIFKQLQIEEALIRCSDQNFCIINEGTSPAIVLGISQKPEEYVNLEHAKNDQVPIIKRFSGGGTVFVDNNTIFVSFIFASSFFSFDPYPENILKFTEEFYQKVFPLFDFKLIDRDYTILNKKFGGNAQYIKKERWLHHTSFLWDFDIVNMNKYLLHPKKEPIYREKRDHQDFLINLSQFLSKKELLQKIFEELKKLSVVNIIDLFEANKFLSLPHRKSSSYF